MVVGKEVFEKRDIHSQKQEAVLKATAVRSPLPVMSLILPCPPCLVSHTGQGGGVQAGGSMWGRRLGVGEGEGVGGGAGDISSTLPCTALPHGASP